MFDVKTRRKLLDEFNTFLASGSNPPAYIADVYNMMSVMLCLQMHGIYKCWGVVMVGFFVERINSERTYIVSCENDNT